MAREQTQSKRQMVDEDEEDEQGLSVPPGARKGRATTRDEDDDQDVTPARGRTASANAAADADISFDDEDAIETGLFASGPATIVESVIDRFKFGAAGAFPAWILVFERDGERYEQPYSIGSGWEIDRNGRLVAKHGQKALAKSCNAIKHLVTPFKAACEAAQIEPLRLTPSTMGQLIGAQVEVERVPQEKRDFADTRGRDRGADRERGRVARGSQEDTPREKTILEIRTILSAPWVKGAGSSTGSSSRQKASAPRPTNAAPSTTDVSLEEEAIEALIAVVEEGPLTIGEALEQALEAHFKGRKGMGAVVDLASSKKFLKTEQGWSFDGKVVDAAAARP